MSAIKITLRGKPEAKGRARIGKLANGRPVAFTPAHTRKYESALRLLAQEEMGPRPPISGPVRVSVAAFVPIAPSWSKKKQAAARAGLIFPTSRPDGDNYLKIACDGINGIVFTDDSQAVDKIVRKRYSDIPRLEIVVEEMTVEVAA